MAKSVNEREKVREREREGGRERERMLQKRVMNPDQPILPHSGCHGTEQILSPEGVEKFVLGYSELDLLR